MQIWTFHHALALRPLIYIDTGRQETYDPLYSYVVLPSCLNRRPQLPPPYTASYQNNH
jgi:hypothetical protein